MRFQEKIDGFLVRYLAYFNYKRYTKRLNLNAGEEILEVGSGGGNLSRFLVKELKEGSLTCLDSSRYSLHLARKRLKNFTKIYFLLEDIIETNLKQKYDKILFCYVLHDITKEERGKVISKCRNFLKSNGNICIREPIRTEHGMPTEEIEDLMTRANLIKIFSKEGYSFPLKGKIYEGIFQNSTTLE